MSSLPSSSLALLASLRAAFSGRLVSDPAGMAPWLRDYRQRWGGPALAVVQPDSTADVAAVVRWNQGTCGPRTTMNVKRTTDGAGRCARLLACECRSCATRRAMRT